MCGRSRTGRADRESGEEIGLGSLVCRLPSEVIAVVLETLLSYDEMKAGEQKLCISEIKGHLGFLKSPEWNITRKGVGHDLLDPARRRWLATNHCLPRGDEYYKEIEMLATGNRRRAK